MSKRNYLPEKFMRRDGEKYEDWLLRMLWCAYLEARKHKRCTVDQYKFELNAVENLIKLRDDIMERNYEPGRGIAFVINNPVIREIFAGPFRDRVVHHLLYNLSYEWWDRRLIYDSYSCRVGKGTLLGAQRLRQQENQALSEYKEPVYIIKMDIQGYFMSLPRKKLYQRITWGLDRQFPDSRPREYYMAKFLWRKIIYDDPIKGVCRKGSPEMWKKLPNSKSLFCQRDGVGIVIGNLSSQLLSNIYLDQLDRYVKYNLKCKYYGRYVDDFYILVSQSQLEQALKDCKAIKTFLQGLKLQLHSRKFYIQNVQRGVVYLGMRVYPNRILPGPRIIARYRQAAKQVVAGTKDDSTMVSYLGHLVHLKAEKIQSQIFDEVGWDWTWWGKGKFTGKHE